MLRAYLDVFNITYLDNIFIYFKNNKDYIKHVRTVLRCLDKYNL
jgi:hypothetical protein